MEVRTNPTDIEIAPAGTITRHNYARSGYDRLMTGVYARTPDISHLNKYDQQLAELIWRTKAALARYEGSGAVLYGPTAFEIMRIPLPKDLEDWDNCHILFPDRAGRPKRQGVIAHHSPQPLQVWRTFHGLPVLHPARTWLQLRGATDDQMIEVGEGFLRRKKPLLQLDDLKAELGRCDGLTGIKQARRVFPRLREGTDSLPETSTRLTLVRAGLPEPAVDRVIMCGVGGVFYRVDMAYDKPKVAPEYDGADHADPAQMQEDVLRRRLLYEAGWLVITATAADLREPGQFIRSVESALVLRGGV